MPKISVENLLYSDNLGNDLLESSSSDDSDCECKFQNAGSINQIINNLSDLEFQHFFRVSRKTFQEIVGYLHLHDHFFKDCCEKVNLEVGLLILLNFLGSQDSMHEIARRFNIPKYCMHSIILSATTYFSSNMVIYIKMPNSVEVDTLSNDFHNICKMESIIGAIGHSHIQIQEPIINAENFLTPNGYFMFQIQGLIATDFRFLDCFVGDGSLNEIELFNKSKIDTKLSSDSFEGYYFISHNSYDMVRVKPSFEALQLTKKCFGLLKGRFRRLSEKMDFADINFVCQCIQTACVLHNICIKFNDDCKFE